jgi:hypothetical protein
MSQEFLRSEIRKQSVVYGVQSTMNSNGSVQPISVARTLVNQGSVAIMQGNTLEIMALNIKDRSEAIRT